MDIRLNEHIEDDGPTVFRHACKLGLRNREQAEGADGNGFVCPAFALYVAPGG